MFPIYRFSLGVSGTLEQAYPIYKSDLAIDFEKQSGQQFFRRKLVGNLRFERNDYQRIVNAPFDTQFQLYIYISYDAGQSWSEYWQGRFWKTDCEFDGDAQTVSVKPELNDAYQDVLNGMEKEFNLIDLAPQITPVTIDKRPMIQVYVPGQTAIGCFLSGMWWEEECEPIEYAALYDMHFARAMGQRLIELSGSYAPSNLTSVFVGDTFPLYAAYGIDVTRTSGNYRFRYVYHPEGVQSQPEYAEYSISRISDGVTLFFLHLTDNIPYTAPFNVTLPAVSGSGAMGAVQLYVHDISVFSRIVCDKDSISGSATYPIGADDIMADNKNYHYVKEYNVSSGLRFSTELTSTPNQWGLYKPGQYYQRPFISATAEAFPVARSAWTQVSLWLGLLDEDFEYEARARAPFTLKDAYPLSSVISVLLGQIAPGITHDATPEYSQFLYGINPLTGIAQTLLITPKSNVISSGYDQPAQKAPITLRNVLDMLRDCYCCYWYIDADNRFRIEHIQYFKQGGSYSGTPTIGIDLPAMRVSRNNKDWSFASNQFKYDKPEMTSRYQFGWMDEVTELFEGFPIDIPAKYIDQSKIEEIRVSQFTSDVDYILLQPGDISKDGFVLLSAREYTQAALEGQYFLPYYTFSLGYPVALQNGYAAFVYLQDYYAYDMPALIYNVGSVTKVAAGVKKLKSQTISFPALTDPDMVRLIRTGLGNGVIEKLSINLSSRNAEATLKYDTE